MQVYYELRLPGAYRFAGCTRRNLCGGDPRAEPVSSVRRCGVGEPLTCSDWQLCRNRWMSAYISAYQLLGIRRSPVLLVRLSTCGSQETVRVSSPVELTRGSGYGLTTSPCAGHQTRPSSSRITVTPGPRETALDFGGEDDMAEASEIPEWVEDGGNVR
jgi:hypothetical protein